jgi:hypothetical protein
MARGSSFHGRFGTYILQVNGQRFYFQTAGDMKQWFKEQIKIATKALLKAKLQEMLLYIPTESGQLAEAVYTSSKYAMVDWRNSFITQVKVIDPKFYGYRDAANVKLKPATKKEYKFRNVAHSNSRHTAIRAPSTIMNNPNVHPIGTKGSAYIYNRDDPLAVVNFLHKMRSVLADAVNQALLMIVRKKYYTNYRIKVSQTQYDSKGQLSTAPDVMKRKLIF